MQAYASALDPMRCFSPYVADTEGKYRKTVARQRVLVLAIAGVGLLVVCALLMAVV